MHCCMRAHAHATTSGPLMAMNLNASAAAQASIWAGCKQHFMRAYMSQVSTGTSCGTLNQLSMTGLGEGRSHATQAMHLRDDNMYM